jgi:hypothetical protein
MKEKYCLPKIKARATGVSQSQIRRILPRTVKRHSENVKKICNFFDLLLAETHDKETLADEAY